MILVMGFGSRHLDETDEANRRMISDALVAVEAQYSEGTTFELIQGGATGADTILAEEAVKLGWTVTSYDADWDGPCRPECQHGERGVHKDGTTYCQGAGWFRNHAMLNRVPRHAIGVRGDGAANKGTNGVLRRINPKKTKVTRLVGTRRVTDESLAPRPSRNL